ncbi:MAG: hypothetical protein QXG97_00135 [Nitrososphaerota archaeon]
MPTSAYNKFHIFVEDLAHGVHSLNTHTLKVLLTNTAPSASDTDYDSTFGPPAKLIPTSNAAEISAGNGYTAGGNSVTITTASQSSGTYTLAGNQVVFTASGGSMATFRYAVLYNSSGGAAATRPLIAWFDYGSSLTLNSGETLTIKFNNSSPGTIFTIT